MGFSATVYNNTVQSITSAQLNRMNNPYWKFTDKSPTQVCYWNINNKMSTLDIGKKDTYDQIGKKSSLRYNRIDNFILYGLPKFSVDLNLEEFGVQSSDIGGEALILPNTIIPSVDDYFTISYISKPYLFRVTKQTIDNLENDSGVNFYKITFELDNTRQDYIDSLNSRQLVNKYKFDISRVGTNMTPIISYEEDTALSTLASLYDTMRENYINLFWRDNVQAFICGYADGMWFYDPYLTEFIIRNELFNDEDETKFLYVDQAVHKSSTFAIEYDRTLFADFENRNPKMSTNSAYAVPVHDPNSLLVDRMEDYFELSIHKLHSTLAPINQINMNLFDHIEQNTPFNEEDTSNKVLYWNILVNWMNNENYSMTAPQLQSLDKLRYRYTKDLFYEIPLLMFVLKSYMASLTGDNGGDDNNDTLSTTAKYLEECYNVGK